MSSTLTPGVNVFDIYFTQISAEQSQPGRVLHRESNSNLHELSPRHGPLTPVQLGLLQVVLHAATFGAKVLGLVRFLYVPSRSASKTSETKSALGVKRTQERVCVKREYKV